MTDSKNGMERSSRGNSLHNYKYISNGNNTKYISITIYCQIWSVSDNHTTFGFLVSTYVVCERLSVMHQPARLPENFDQILQITPPPPFWNSVPEDCPPPKIKIVPRVQVQPYLEHPTPPPPKNEKL